MVTGFPVWVSITSLALGGLFGVGGSGNVKEETRQVGAFTGLEVSGGIEIDLETGQQERVVVRADDNLVPLVVTEVKQGVLRIYTKENIAHSKELRVKVSARDIRSLRANGGCEVKARLGRVPELSLVAKGGVELDASGIDADRVKVDFSGGVDAKLVGKAKVVDYDASGGVDIDAANLLAETAKVDLSGGVDAKIAAAQQLEGDASGGVDLQVRGRPSVKVDASGGASVRTE